MSPEVRAEAAANASMSTSTMVWKDEASAARAMAMLMNRSARPEAVVQLLSCTMAEWSVTVTHESVRQ